MYKQLNAIVIDDEPIALDGLIKYIKKIEYLQIVGTGENAKEAIELLKEKKVDIMFLDINMPKISGIQLLRSLETIPLTIITTAYPNYALEGFELDVIDYVVKPIDFLRFKKACDKANSFYKAQDNTNTSLATDYIFIKCDKTIEKIFFRDILFIEALNNYIAVHTTTTRYISYLSLKNIEQSLPKELFLKIQKSFIVAINQVNSIEDGIVKIRNKSISISRINKEEIMKIILQGKLIKR